LPPPIVTPWASASRKIPRAKPSATATGSVSGAFGLPIQKCAELLLKKGRVHLLATDAHSPKKRPPIVQDAFAAACEIVGEDGARTLLITNPSRIFSGAPAANVTPVPPRKRRGLFAALLR